MNEKIKQLIIESVNFELDPDSNCHEAQVCPEDLEHLAELIIRECADVCYRIDGEYDGEDIMATWCAEGILKHFGVEK